jgi:hypothetical protein
LHFEGDEEGTNMMNYIPISPMGYGFKIFYSESGVHFIYTFYDQENKRWVDGMKIFIPTELARKILKSEFLYSAYEGKKKDDSNGK